MADAGVIRLFLIQVSHVDHATNGQLQSSRRSPRAIPSSSSAIARNLPSVVVRTAPIVASVAQGSAIGIA